MFKYIRGDLLIFTNRGLKRMDNITKEDLILAITKDGKYYYEEIDEITKVFKNNYNLNKINFYNNIDSYYLNDNIEIKAIQQIPLNLEIQELNDHLYYNNHCITKTKINDLSSFDFISVPTSINLTLTDDSNDDSNDDYYRYQGILFASSLKFNNEKQKESIEFVINYLKENDVNFTLTEDKLTTTIIINDNKIPKLNLFKVLTSNKENLKLFINGLTEISTEILLTKKEDLYIIKYAYIKLGVSISSYINNGAIQVKVPRKLTSYYHCYFNYNNQIHNKVKSIKKTQMKGFLYSLKLKTNNFYLTDMGFIS